MGIENQVLDSADTEISPQVRHKRKLLKEEEERKKRKKVVQTFLEVVSDRNHPKGGKVRLVRKMNNANVHRTYIGREKQLKKLIAEYKAKNALMAG